MARVNLQMGRARVTRAVSPREAGYVKHMRGQMNHLVNRMNKIVRGIRDITPAALENALEPIYNESQRLVPKDTHRLARSGFIEVRSRGDRISGAIGYGQAGDPPYTTIVHERLDVKHAAPTQAKFLEEPVQKQMKLIPARVANFYRKQTGIK